MGGREDDVQVIREQPSGIGLSVLRRIGHLVAELPASDRHGPGAEVLSDGPSGSFVISRSIGVAGGQMRSVCAATGGLGSVQMEEAEITRYVHEARWRLKLEPGAQHET
jgi:hypothetical protein